MKIAEGAEAVIYEGVFLGKPAIIKERIKKDYRNEVLDAKLRKMRTLNEARIIALASASGINAPFIFLVSGYSIIMSRIDGTNLNLLMNKKRPDDLLIKKIAVQLAKMHKLNIIHRDFTPANIIVDKENDPYIIDFGLSEIKSSIEEKAIDVLLMKRAIAKKEFEIFIEEYTKNIDFDKKILERVREIEKRGRYQIRSLS